jgi:hypothetical protein
MDFMEEVMIDGRDAILLEGVGGGFIRYPDIITYLQDTVLYDFLFAVKVVTMYFEGVFPPCDICFHICTLEELFIYTYLGDDAGLGNLVFYSLDK